ncbi:MAG: EAL domain-containing protein [Candidatus Accumulibacter sp.]|uniref:EAL domain-containing protein n=1 Tax=Accumulibacter sp. TaxID=2053492 RepID=UPI001A46E97D|nr:EAL domain-containing protein [Accumulibacter sp.]MBL8394550.1 EAL domain-containing protein [Accumulibacter sp.]
MNAWLRPASAAVLGFLAVLFAIWALDHSIVRPAFVELEQAQALEDGRRARAAVDSELRQLGNELGDWAEWDDAYAFAANRNPAFISSNLGDWRTLEKSARLNLCFIFARDGQVLYGGAYDARRGGTVSLAAFAGEAPAVWSLLQPSAAQGQAKSGLLLSERGLLLLAARPILTTQGRGPARGLLVFGRFLDEKLLRTLVAQTQVAFDLLPASDPRLSADERGYLASLPAGEAALRPGPAGSLMVYELLSDLAGQPTALLRTPIRQEISTTARRTGQALMGTLGLLALALLLGGAWWRERVAAGRTVQVAGNSAAWSTAALVMLAGLVLTFGVFAEWRQRAEDGLARDFRSAASERAERIISTIQENLEDLDTVRRFFAGVESVSRQQFSAFVTPILEQHSFRALEWLPRVTRQQRAAHEAAARRDGLEGFQFTERDAEGRLVPAAERDEYYPVYFLEPYVGNAAALGFAPDAAHPARGAALARARDVGQLAASGRYVLVQEPASEQRFSVLVFAPVHEGSVATPVDEHVGRPLRGLVLGVMRIGEMVSDALRVSEAGQLSYRLTDLSADGEQQWLYDHPSTADFTAAVAAGLHFQRDFALADRVWRIEVAASNAFVDRHLDSIHRWIPVTGGLLTLFAALYLFALISQRQRAEALVAERTLELQASEAQSRHIVEHAPFGFHFYRLTDDGHLMLVGANPAADAILGMEHAAFVGQSLEVVFPALATTEVPVAYRHLAQSGGAQRWPVVRYRDQRIDGAFEVVAFQIVPGLIAAAFSDITERWQAEAALQDSEARYRIVSLLTGQIIYDYDCRSGAIQWAGAISGITGYRADEFAVVDLAAWVTLIHPDDRPHARALLDQAMASGTAYTVEYRLRSKDGPYRWIEHRGAFLRDPEGRAYRMVGTLQDITARQETEAALSASEQRFRSMIEHAPDGIVLFNETIIYASPAIHALLGYTPEEALGLVPEELTHPDDRPALSSLLDDLRRKPGQTMSTRYRVRHKEGSWRWLESTLSNLSDEASVGALVCNFRDITERQEAEAHLRLAAAVFQAARDAIVVTDAEWKIVAINPAFTVHAGYTEAEVRGRSPRLLWADRQPEEYFAAVLRALRQEDRWHGEFWVRCKDGERRAALASLGAVRDANGCVTHYVGVATDITALKAAEQRIEHLAYYDALTDLPNRALLAQRAEFALALAARHHGELTLLFLDLDQFKQVNDSLGHAEGDALLVQAATRLQKLTRGEDTVCRLGGDEFVLLLPDTGQEGALRVTDKLLVAFRQPFAVGGHPLRATVSIGIALYPHDGTNFAELQKNADTALYRAKQDGRNTRVFYDRKMNAATLDRLVLESELRQALASGQLRAYYQPKLRLCDGETVGAEALVRWQHPEHGLIPPGRFIPVAEGSDLIVELGAWMLTEVCRQLAAWRAARLPPLSIAVNLSARHFRQPGLADWIGEQLEANRLRPEALELELTESSLLEAGPQTAETLLALEQLGTGLAIDDFGTGYSSLSYLKRLPLTALKIDRSFVRDLVSDPDDRTIAATIVALGHGLGLKVVAEGVETAEQRSILLEQGCDLAQGYLFGPPLPPEDFAAVWLGVPSG